MAGNVEAETSRYPGRVGGYVDRLNFDIVIRNGRIVDDTGNPWFKADIGIEKGKIAKLSAWDAPYR